MSILSPKSLYPVGMNIIFGAFHLLHMEAYFGSFTRKRFLISPNIIFAIKSASDLFIVGF